METPTEMNDEARRIAEVPEIAAPEQASADELQQWVSWWKASYEAARGLSDERDRRRRDLKSTTLTRASQYSQSCCRTSPSAKAFVAKPVT